MLGYTRESDISSLTINHLLKVESQDFVRKTCQGVSLDHDCTTNRMKKLIPKRPGTPAEPTPDIPPKFAVLAVIPILDLAHSAHFGGDFRRVAGLGS